MASLFWLSENCSLDKKVGEEKKTSLLSQLPLILSRQTMDKLCFADQYQKTGSTSLPCVAEVNKLVNGTLQFQFYESSNVNPISVDNIDLGEYRITADSLYCTCKYGWLFLSMIKSSCRTTSTSFLLYSSLTKNIITLPTFVHSKTHHYSKLVQAFSADPSSPDCVFLVLHYDMDIDNKITISTCHYGDEEWTSREFERGDINYMCFGSTPVYLGGSFYFVSSVGEVASYNIAVGEWKAVRNSFNGITHCNTGYEAFELNGELGLIYFYDHDYLKSSDGDKLGYIRMFHHTDKIWVRLESLGDEALYVSSNTFSISTAGEEARNNGIMANKIYRPDETGCISVYTLENGYLTKFNTCSGSRNRERVMNCRKQAFWVEPRHQLEKQTQSSVVVGSMENKRKEQMIEVNEVFGDDSQLLSNLDQD